MMPLVMEAFVLIVSFVLGALVGSFTNVLIYRLPRKENIAFPPSHCPHCDHRLGVLDLVPIFSWLALRGKCRYCGKPIKSRYPIVELVTAVFYTAIAYFFNPLDQPLLTVGYWFLFTILLAGSAIDLETFELPDELTIPAIGVGLAIAAFLGFLPRALEGALIGAGLISAINAFGAWVMRRFREPVHPALPIGYLNIHLAGLVGALFGVIPAVIAGIALAVIHFVIKRPLPFLDLISLGGFVVALAFKASSGGLEGVIQSLSLGLQGMGAMAILTGLYWWFAPDVEDDTPEDELDPIAMGFGDVKLWAAVGAFLGWQGALFGIAAAVAAGAVIGVALLLRGGSRQIPFGPYLALGALVALFTGSAPLLEYLRSLGLF
jgi:leader peptidase (prepilin peptidase) / N-methyltransferase